MIAETENELVAAEVDRLWFKDSEKIKAFLLEEFCNLRTRRHLKTAGLWKYLIEHIIAADEPAKYTPPSCGLSLEAWVPLVMAAGGYGQLEQIPVTVYVAAENFGLCKNAAKMHLHRIRRRSEIFFERGGQYIPAQREIKAEKVKIYNPLIYKLDRPVFHGLAQWKTPTYKMKQQSPEVSSIITITGKQSDEGIRNCKEIDTLDEIIPYHYSKLKGSIARLPCPSPMGRGGRWEYPDFDDEFWTFTREYEGEYAYRAAMQSCLAEVAGKKYAEVCAASKHNPSQLEGRAVLTFGDSGSPFLGIDVDQRVKIGNRDTLVAQLVIKENFSIQEEEPAQRGFTITLKGKGFHWKIEHTKLGSGIVLKVNGDIVCCKFTSGRANLTVGTIKRKTGIDLKKKFALHEALARLTAQRWPTLEKTTSPSFGSELIRNSAEQGSYAQLN
jgi:hypothetical protein